MPESQARADLRQRFCAAAARDERIVGLLQGGSGSEGRLDQWSDLDLFLFLQDSEAEAFRHAWEEWAQHLGQLLLSYHPEGQTAIAWTIFHAVPVPLRVDMRFIAASEMDSILTWPTRPCSVEEMVWIDKTGGQLRSYAEQLLGQSLALPSSQQTEAFEQYTARLWYFLHSAYGKLMRGHEWYARVSFHLAVLDSLMALLKLEAGALERWQASFPSWKIEDLISSARLAQLQRCIPGPGADQFKAAMLSTAQLASEVCDALARHYQHTWPCEAAEEILHMLLMQPQHG